MMLVGCSHRVAELALGILGVGVRKERRANAWMRQHRHFLDNQTPKAGLGPRPMAGAD